MELSPERDGLRLESTTSDPTATSVDEQTRLPVFEVITLALLYIKGKVLDLLKMRMFNNGEAGIRWVVTVPAVWNEFGKNIMREAALKAGMISRRDYYSVSDGLMSF